MNLTEAYPIIKSKVNEYLQENKGGTVEAFIDELGQVAKVKERLGGSKVTNQGCMKGFALSLFSSQTDWGRVQDNMNILNENLFNIDAIDYAGYKEEAIDVLMNRIIGLGFTSRYFKNDLMNLKKFCMYIKNNNFNPEGYDLFDKYVTLYGTGSSPEKRRLISDIQKFGGMGVALSAEFLRNIGFDMAKPDVHIMRLLSTDKLGAGSWAAADDYKDKLKFDAIDIISKSAAELKIYEAEMDNVFWLYCAISYCNICGSKPKCGECPEALKEKCNYKNIIVPEKENMDRDIFMDIIDNSKATDRSPVLIEKSISSSGTKYDRLSLPKANWELVDFDKIYTIKYNSQEVKDYFSKKYCEMDSETFKQWSRNRLCNVTMDISEINNRVITITKITPR